jgi:putative ABC transport system permease protein
MIELFSDIRFAIRSLRKSPTFAIISLTVLVLGIGANIAVFSIVNAILLRPLPYKDADRIVEVQTVWLQRHEKVYVSAPDFRDWRQQSQSFEALALYDDRETSVFVNKAAERVMAGTVTGDFFRVFGIQPVLGRTFLPEEEVQGSNPVAVVSEEFFNRAFQGRRDALGQTIKMWQRDFTLIGVLPRGFHFETDVNVWVPAIWNPISVALDGKEFRDGYHYEVFGRLKQNATLKQAQVEMKGVAARLASTYKEDANISATVTGLQDTMTSGIRATLYFLLLAVFLVLVVSCSNVANLLLARVALRKQEFALRVALGASRTHIVTQLLTEAFVLAVPAGLLGLFLGWLSASGLSHLAPANLTQLSNLTLDWRVACFAILAAIVSTVMFGLAPGFQGANVNLNKSLREGGSYTVVRGGMGRLRAGIVITEIAISMSLLIGAGLMIRSFSALASTNRGYQVEGTWAMESMFPAAGIEDSRRAVVFYDQLLQAAATMPGIQKVAAANYLPNGSTASGTFSIEGRNNSGDGERIPRQASFILISPNYFNILGVSLLKGRDFNNIEGKDSQLTCIINSALARQYFPEEDPIGRRLKTGLDGTDYMTVAGVFGDIRQVGLEQPPKPAIYMPFQQHPLAAKSMKLLFRGSGDNMTAANGLRSAVSRLNPEVAIRFLPLTQQLESTFAPSRFRSILIGLFAALALVLASAGLYGVMSYSVTQRGPEIGVRVALGAQPGQIIRLILKQGLWLISVGIVLGAAFALGFSTMITSLVYGVKANDPTIFTGVAVILGGVALSAMYIPARRAAAVDPLKVLRRQ